MGYLNKSSFLLCTICFVYKCLILISCTEWSTSNSVFAQKFVKVFFFSQFTLCITLMSLTHNCTGRSFQFLALITLQNNTCPFSFIWFFFPLPIVIQGLWWWLWRWRWRWSGQWWRGNTIHCMYQQIPGAHPTNDISIEFETRPKVAMLQFQIYSTDHNEILHVTTAKLSWHVQNFVVIVCVYFYPSALRAGGVLSLRSGRAGGWAGGRLPNLRNPYPGNRLTDFLNSKFCGII